MTEPVSDPFLELRLPVDPIDPDPAFASHLRARLDRALSLPKGVVVSTTTLDQPSTSVATSVARATVTPYLAVKGARQALDWYAEAFGAELRGQAIVMPDGRIGHAELSIGGALIMLSEEYPEIGVAGPAPGQGVPVTLHLEVPDVDALLAEAVDAGATLERPAADYEYGRNGVVRDPFGHRWLIASPPAHAGLRHGDLGYVSLWVPSVERAARFFPSVLGWRLEPGSGAGGRQVAGLQVAQGLWEHPTEHTLFCCFSVNDVSAAVARVRSAGGTAGEPQPRALRSHRRVH